MSNLLSTYMMAYPDRFYFAEDDRRQCFDLISTLLAIAKRDKEVLRQNLEEDAYQTDVFLLKKALFLYIDNVDYKTADEILQSYIVYGGYARLELLEKLIIHTAIMSLYKGDSPLILEERLNAFIGEKLLSEFDSGQGDPKRKPPKTVAVEPVAPQFTLRRKIAPAPVMSDQVLSQSEIDELLVTLLS